MNETAVRRTPSVGDTVITDGSNYHVESVDGLDAVLRSRAQRGERRVAIKALRWDAIRRTWSVAR